MNCEALVRTVLDKSAHRTIVESWIVVPVAQLIPSSDCGQRPLINVYYTERPRMRHACTRVAHRNGCVPKFEVNQEPLRVRSCSQDSHCNRRLVSVSVCR